jgi:chromosome segregation ATPase
VTEQPSVEALVERVRDSLLALQDAEVYGRGKAALDSLTAALERAERERDEWRERYDGKQQTVNDLTEFLRREKARAQKAEAELETVRSERDDELFTEREQVRRAEAVVEAARAILTLADEERDELAGEVSKYLEPWADLVEALTAYDADLIPSRRDGEPPTEEGGVT